MLFAIEHPRLAMISQLQWTQRETKIQVRSKGLLVRADVGVEKLCGERMLEKHVFFFMFQLDSNFSPGKGRLQEAIKKKC